MVPLPWTRSTLRLGSAYFQTMSLISGGSWGNSVNSRAALEISSVRDSAGSKTTGSMQVEEGPTFMAFVFSEAASNST